jgi:hypothetical protein
MAAFDELDWTRFDVWAALAREGVVVVDTAHRESCLAWLRQEGYGIESIDFGQGIGPATLVIRDLLRWEERFGTPADPESLNLVHSSSWRSGRGSSRSSSLIRGAG